ncbi:MAG: glycosyltransferase [Blautia sp.]
MKKVLIFGLSSLYAGVEALILNYVNHLDENEYAVDLVVTERKPEYLDDKLLRNVDIRIVPNRVRNYVAYVKSMDKIVKTGGYDIIWANFCTLTDIQVLKSAQKYDVPIRIAHSHNSENMGSFLVMATHLMNKKKLFSMRINFMHVQILQVSLCLAGRSLNQKITKLFLMQLKRLNIDLHRKSENRLEKRCNSVTRL